MEYYVGLDVSLKQTSVCVIPYAFVWLDPGITPCCKTLIETNHER